MKRKTQTFSKELRMPKLYRNDLEKIEKIIKEELKPREYKLETKDYEYESLDSIPRNSDCTTELNIYTFSPYINIDFNKHSARVYVGDDDLTTTGAITKIMAVILRKERKILFWIQSTASWVAPIIFIATVLPIIKANKLASGVALGIAVSAVIWWITGYYMSLHRFSEIYFISSNENPGFLKRNKDQIITGVIVAVISFILGKLA